MTLPHIPQAPTQSLGVAGAGQLPRVNLMPPEIAAAARFRRVQLAMAGAGLAAVALVGVLAYSAHHSVSTARGQLDAAHQQKARLQSELASLQSVRDVFTQVAAKQAMLSQALAPEIRWSYYMTDLSLKVPDHVWLTALNATETGVGSSTSGSTMSATETTSSALMPAGLGTITFSGTAFSHDDVATWLDSLAKERGYANPYFSNSTEARQGSRSVVNFTSSVTLTQDALSGRYAAGEK